MSTKRSNRCRLRFEVLEGREVPAVVFGEETPLPEVPVDETPVVVVDDTPVVVVDETPVTETPTDEIPVDEGEIITVTNELDGEPVVTQIDLAAFSSVDKMKPSIGDIVTVRFTMANNGDVPATNAKMMTTLPAGMTFLSATTTQGDYDATTGEWSAGIVYPGQPLTLTIKAKVIDPAEQTVSGSISASDSPDPNTENNTASTTVAPVLAGVTVSQVASSQKVIVNGTVIFTLTVKNSGPGIARNVAIKETFGSGMNWVRILQPTHGVFNAKTKTWNLAWLNPGTTATVRVVAQVMKPGRIEATATMTGTGIDETRSKFEAKAAIVGTKTNSPATWSFSAPSYRPHLVATPPTKTSQAKVTPPASFSAELRKIFRLPQLGV